LNALEQRWFDSQYGPHRAAEARDDVKHLLAWGRGDIDELHSAFMGRIVTSYELQALMFEMSDQRHEAWLKQIQESLGA
jgi:hypothetical protein